MIKPVPFQWPYALLFWAVFVWAYVPEFGMVRRAKQRQTATDSKSLQVILIGQSVATFAGFWLSRSAGWRISASHELIVFFIGVAILISGSLLRRHCFRMLGSSFTGDVRAGMAVTVSTDAIVSTPPRWSPGLRSTRRKSLPFTPSMP